MKAEENICHHTAANLRRSRVESRSHLAARVTPSYEDAIFILVLLCLLTTANTRAAIKSQYQL